MAPRRGATRFGRRKFGARSRSCRVSYASYEADDIIPELSSRAGSPTVPRGRPAAPAPRKVLFASHPRMGGSGHVRGALVVSSRYVAPYLRSCLSGSPAVPRGRQAAPASCKVQFSLYLRGWEELASPGRTSRLVSSRIPLSQELSLRIPLSQELSL